MRSTGLLPVGYGPCLHASPVAPVALRGIGFVSPAWRVDRMTVERRERLTPEHRLTSPLHHAAVKEGGVAFRGRSCLAVVLARAGETTRFGFVASRKSVGGAVQRNRARRRLREIVRRRWPRIREHGFWVVFVAFRAVLTAPHQDLATDVEQLLARAGVLEPIPFEGVADA